MFEQMIHLIKRKGLLHSIKFIGTRLFRVQRHVVFKHDTAEDPPSIDWPQAMEVVSLKMRKDITHEIRDQLLSMTPDNETYINDIGNGSCIGLIVRSNRKIVHFGFIMFGSRTLCSLGLPTNAALLGNAYTIPAFRGQGIQTKSIAYRLQLAHEQGSVVAYSETKPENHASQKGITRGGMKKLGTVKLFIICNILVIRVKRSYRVPLISICRQRNI